MWVKHSLNLYCCVFFVGRESGVRREAGGGRTGLLLRRTKSLLVVYCGACVLITSPAHTRATAGCRQHLRADEHPRPLFCAQGVRVRFTALRSCTTHWCCAVSAP